MTAIHNAGAAVLGPTDGKLLLPIPGSPILFKVWGQREPGNYDFAEFSLAPGKGGPRPHRHHTNEELFYVLEGELEFLVGERSVLIGPGSVAFIPPDTVHAFRNPGPEQARFLLIASPSGLYRYFEEMAALSTTGNLGAAAMTELRLRYDTEEVDVAWGVGKTLT
jgi:mannose-6-phosphate isomerase-like protein (cupin superfamily)